MDMLTIEVTTCLVVTLLLTATPAVADAARELVRCQTEAEHLYPTPTTRVSRIGQNGKPTYGNGPRILKPACGTGYSVTAECSAPLKTKLYEDR